MNAAKKIKTLLETDQLTARICEVYGCDPSRAAHYGLRFAEAAQAFDNQFPASGEASVFTAPGRTEIGGNHTDHQHGHVLAGSVDLDVIAVAAPNSDGLIRIKSEGYPVDIINVMNLRIHNEEINHSASLIRGIAARFSALGYPVSGFDAYTTSNVLSGSGLSSSAAFEVLVGNIINTFFAGGLEDVISIAQIGQYAENVYYQKPCGLMDQMASSVGGIITIDFKSTTDPVVEKVDYDFAHSGYALVIIDSGADHGDLTGEYAAIPSEMQAAAAVFGQKVLRDVDPQLFYGNIHMVREKAGDRAALRAMHFFEEDKRVSEQVAALRAGNFDVFKQLIIASGRSSGMYLQNVFAASKPQEQAVSIVLALCEKLLAGKGAWRVHGGGFAGTVQAFVPLSDTASFKKIIEKQIGKDKCHILNIRPVGGTCLWK